MEVAKFHLRCFKEFFPFLEKTKTKSIPALSFHDYIEREVFRWNKLFQIKTQSLYTETQGIYNHNVTASFVLIKYSRESSFYRFLHFSFV